MYFMSAKAVLHQDVAHLTAVCTCPRLLGLHSVCAAGQTNYSAANAGLDASCRLLQAAGVDVMSIQFSAWAGAGMAAATASKVDAMGIGALSPATGLAALEAAVRNEASTRYASGQVSLHMCLHQLTRQCW